MLKPGPMRGVRRFSDTRTPHSTDGSVSRCTESPSWSDSMLSNACRMALMCAGVVPQQPPTILAPRARNSGTMAAKYSGPASYWKRPSTRVGKPALGIADSQMPGRAARRVARTSSRAVGPTAQFAPSTSIGRSVSISAAAAASRPKRVSPSALNVRLASTGRSDSSLMARTACRSSSTSVMVSTQKRSTPPPGALPLVRGMRSGPALWKWTRGVPERGPGGRCHRR